MCFEFENCTGFVANLNIFFFDFVLGLFVSSDLTQPRSINTNNDF
jgi:hypothetical protein